MFVFPADIQNGKTTNGVSNGIHLPTSHIRFAESKICSRLFDFHAIILLFCCHTQLDFFEACLSMNPLELCLFCLLCFSSTELPPHLEKIKQQANDAFARQQWTQAIQLYSLGIHQASYNAMLYGNRAAAYMKRKWYVPLCRETVHRLIII